MTTELKPADIATVLDALEDLAESASGGPTGSSALRRAFEQLGSVFGLDLVALMLHNLDGATGYLAAHNQLTNMNPAVLDPGLLMKAKPDLTQEGVCDPFTPDHTVAKLLSDVVDLPDLHCMGWQPVWIKDRHVGSLLMGCNEDRPDNEKESLQRLLRVATRMAAVAVKGNPLLDRLKEQTRPLRRDSQRIHRVQDAVDRYREFFDGSADAVIIAERSGKICYVNRAAEATTGYSSDWLNGRRVVELVTPPHRTGLVDVLDHTMSGSFLQSFDVDVETTSGDFITVHMSATLVPGKTDMVVLTFRDITETRAVETELIQTKEFLERLIGSAVDAIVCADTTGTLILFNPGAEGLFGYTAEDVLGKMQFSDLFPGDVALTLLKQLRSSQYGGEGRLDPTRKEVISRDGEQIPVNLTASVIYDEQEEMGVVGVFSDLRERLRLEQRLTKSQEKLVQSEKHALIAELAGTTAHELNQPLTSIMGYAELLVRNLQENDKSRRPAEVIMSEAERMAEIVRKIGKITRYETKAYVGSAQILDLDKSAE